METIKVAVRVRPLNERECQSDNIVSMNDNNLTITEPYSNNEINKTFSYDYCYSSYERGEQYVTQEKIYDDLGFIIIDSAFAGINSCLMAYGQTGSGKTYTMMGDVTNEKECGIIPRICQSLFTCINIGRSINSKESISKKKRQSILFHHDSAESVTYDVTVSYLEIYMEKVRDLLLTSDMSTSLNYGGNMNPATALRVREHPSTGPYVQNLSRHRITNVEEIMHFIELGNRHRTTAATGMNSMSSRSHAIFTLNFVQATLLENGLPSEIHSKVNLIDLAGSERANSTGTKGEQLKEGAAINKSLFSLINVISALADSNIQRRVHIPYRDSVLTWLLKDSLGGNARTIIIATISPSSMNYSETLSTLRYANRAKNIVNKPVVNEDESVRIIRALRAEIEELKDKLANQSPLVSHQRNVSIASIACQNSETNSVISNPMLNKLSDNSARYKILCDKWKEKWTALNEKLAVNDMNDFRIVNEKNKGIYFDSEKPYLLCLNDHNLNTINSGMAIYQLEKGRTMIGYDDSERMIDGEKIQMNDKNEIDDGNSDTDTDDDENVNFIKLPKLNDSFLLKEHCCIIHIVKDYLNDVDEDDNNNNNNFEEMRNNGINTTINGHSNKKKFNREITLIPFPDSECQINSSLIDIPTVLHHGDMILLGSTFLFKYNDYIEYKSEGTKRLSMKDNSVQLMTKSLNALHRSTDSSMSKIELDMRDDLIEKKSHLLKEQQEIVIELEAKYESLKTDSELTSKKYEDLLIELYGKMNVCNQNDTSDENEELNQLNIKCVAIQTEFASVMEEKGIKLNDTYQQYMQEESLLKNLENQTLFESMVEFEVNRRLRNSYSQPNTTTSNAFKKLLQKTVDSMQESMGNVTLDKSVDSLNYHRGIPHCVSNRPNVLVDIISFCHKRNRGFIPRSFVEFQIELKTKNDEWTIYRRYNHFVLLHEYLQSFFGDMEIKAYSLRLPPKYYSFVINDTDRNIRRMGLLRRYLQHVVYVLVESDRSPFHPTKGLQELNSVFLTQFHIFFNPNYTAEQIVF